MGRGSGRVRDIDRGYRRFMQNLARIGGEDRLEVLVGVRAEQGAELVVIAASNEFGTADGHIPERSYLRSTMDERRTQYLDELETIVDRAIDGTQTVRQGLDRLGNRAVGHVKLQIRTLKEPPNAPATIRAKGSDNPLIDTGRLRNSIDYEIRG